nr:hypothetical protein [candidate division Zixibacteria bacterium]
MSHKIFKTAITGLLILTAAAFIGCSGDDDNIKTSAVNQVVADISDSIAEKVVDAAFASAVPEPTLLSGKHQGAIMDIADLLIVDSVAYAVFDGGLIVYDFKIDTFQTISSGEKINAIAMHDGQIYVGGKNLFIVHDNGLETVALKFESEIKALHSFNGQLMIGTGQGLYVRSADNYDVVREDIDVRAMVTDESGLWVGTNGQSMYRMEGGQFKKRFLLRDSTIFDKVNTLDFNNGYVYVGTDEALYIFDGGAWETLTIEDGLPSNTIRDIDASGWVIYVATEAGVIAYYNGDFMPARRLEDKVVNSVQKFHGKLIVGTDSEGLLMKSGAFLKTLVGPNDGGDEPVRPADEAFTMFNN